MLLLRGSVHMQFVRSRMGFRWLNLGFEPSLRKFGTCELRNGSSMLQPFSDSKKQNCTTWCVWLRTLPASTLSCGFNTFQHYMLCLQYKAGKGWPLLASQGLILPLLEKDGKCKTHQNAIKVYVTCFPHLTHLTLLTLLDFSTLRARGLEHFWSPPIRPAAVFASAMHPDIMHRYA